MEWRRAVIADFAPRIDASISPIADWAIYTGAVTAPRDMRLAVQRQIAHPPDDE